MANTRKTLLDTFATQLGTITTANGYNSDQYVLDGATKVYRDETHPADIPTRNIVWSLFDTGPDRHIGYADGNVIIRRASLTVQIHAPTKELRNEVPTDEANDALADLFKLIHAASFATAMGANFRFAKVMDTEISIQSRRALVECAVEMSYWLDGDTP